MRQLTYGTWQFLNRKLIKPNLNTFNPPLILDRGFGTSRGMPLDRPLINEFVRKCSSRLSFGKSLRILEIGDSRYASKFFPDCHIYVLNYKESNAITKENDSTLVGDLVEATSLKNEFDVIISTQVLAFTKNPFNAVKTYNSLLRSGGILIGTEPQISQISWFDDESSGDYFRFTTGGIKQLFSQEELAKGDLETKSLGGWYETFGLFVGIVAQDEAYLGKEQDSQYAPIVAYQYIKH